MVPVTAGDTPSLTLVAMVAGVEMGLKLAGVALAGSGVQATVEFSALPLLGRAREFADDGYVTGASGRNWASYGDAVQLSAGLGDVEKALLTDPQTSGGLLLAVPKQKADRLLAALDQRGIQAAAIGVVTREMPGAIRVKK